MKISSMLEDGKVRLNKFSASKLVFGSVLLYFQCASHTMTVCIKDEKAQLQLVN